MKKRGRISKTAGRFNRRNPATRGNPYPDVPCQHTGIGLNSGSKTMAAEHRKVIVIPLLNIPAAFVTIRTLPKWSRVKYLFLAQ